MPKSWLKYEIDFSFFEKMTPQLAHFIGFWFADGNLYKNRIGFSINEKDKEFLNSLVSQFSNSLSITYKNRPKEYKWEVEQLKLANILRDKYSFIPKKSLICKFPTYIDKDHLKYFLQGYFEGDGWITTRDHNAGFATGSLDFKNGLIDKLSNFEPKVVYNKTWFSVVLTVKNSLKFLSWIYDQNETIKMKRKYDLYLDIKKQDDFNSKFSTIWGFSKIVGRPNQYLYTRLEKNPISPDRVNKNGYKYYNLNKLQTWYNSD